MKKIFAHMKRAVLLGLFVLMACAKEENAYGWEDLDQYQKQIIVGKMNREDVLKIMGKPTAADISLIKEWYYVQLIEVGVSIAKPKVKTHKMLRVIFNDKGVVYSANIENIEESKKRFAQEKTKTIGYQEGFIKDTFGRVGQK